MPLSITITLNGEQKVLENIQGVAAMLTDFTGAMNTIGQELVSYYGGQAFASQGGVFGQKWQALSPAYAKQKAKSYPGKGILERTGTMKNSFGYTAGKTSVVIDNSSPYFAYHQSTEARTKMPRRQMLGINDDVRSIVQQLIEADIAAKIEAAKA